MRGETPNRRTWIRLLTAGISVLLLTITLALPVRAGEDHPEVTNHFCPVMAGEAVDPNISVVHGGRRIYFCCDDCVEEFLKDPAAYLPALSARLEGENESKSAQEAGESESSHGEHEHLSDVEAPLGLLHPILVHFPVALAPVALLAVLLGIVFRGGFFRNCATYAITLAAIFSVPAYFAGQMAAESLGRMSASREASVAAHVDWGLIAMSTLIGAAALHLVARYRARSRSLRVVSDLLIFSAALVVAYTGFLGGEVARGPGHLDALLPW